MKDSSPLDERRSAAKGLNVLAAAGIALIIAAAAVAISMTGDGHKDAASVTTLQDHNA